MLRCIPDTIPYIGSPCMILYLWRKDSFLNFWDKLGGIYMKGVYLISEDKKTLMLPPAIVMSSWLMVKIVQTSKAARKGEASTKDHQNKINEPYDRQAHQNFPLAIPPDHLVLDRLRGRVQV